MTKSKKTAISILLAALLLVVAIGGTLAYLTSTTAATTNEFTFVSGDGGVEGTLTEPNWDPEKAKNVTPGASIKKDPLLTNTGEIPAFFAMQVVFQDGKTDTKLNSTDFAKLIAMLEIDWNTTNWTREGTLAPTTNFVYNTVVAVGAATQPLFNTVKLKSTITTADMTWIADTLGGFNIVVKGAGIQGDGTLTLTTVKSDLLALIPTT